MELYAAIEAFSRSFGAVEIVTRERYVLLRSTRIFADLVIMSDAVRMAVHLKRKVEHPLFFKISSDRSSVTHVAKMRNQDEFESLKCYLREAYEVSMAAK